jgi:hypothetical protein
MKKNACGTNSSMLLLHPLSIKSLQQRKRLHTLASRSRDAKGAQGNLVEPYD